MPSEEYGVLVARAVPLTKPTAAADSPQNVKMAKPSMKGGVDSLSDSLNALQISKVVAAVAANVQSAATPNAAASVAASGAKKQLQQRRSDAAISPADFVNLQSMRSSALARKTNTTSKFNRDCRNLFADLLAPSGGGAVTTECVTDEKKQTTTAAAKPQKLKVEKSNANNNNNGTQTKKESMEKKSSPVDVDDSKESTPRPPSAKEDVGERVANKENAEEEENEDEKTTATDYLLSRGPIRMGRTPTSGGYHPYDANTTTPIANNNNNTDYGSLSSMPYGAAPQSAVNDPSSYSTNAYTYGYDCGAQNGWLNATGGSSGGCFADSRESTPDTVSSDLGYASAASPWFAVHASGYGAGQLDTVAGGYPSGGGRAVAELDDLCSTLRESDLTLLNNNNSNIQNGRGNSNNNKNSFVDTMQNPISYTTGVSSPFSTSSSSSASPPSITQHACYYEHSTTPSGGVSTITSELPDALSDFILKYSRRYTPPDADVIGMEYGSGGDGSPQQLAPNKQQQLQQQQQQQQQQMTTGGYYGAGGSSASSSPLSGYSTGYGSGIESSFSSPKTANGDSQCNSPLGAAAGCLPPKGSPAAPRGGCGEHASPSAAVTAAAAAATSGGAEAAAQLLYSQQTRHAKERLRALIANDDMDKAWAWTLKCIKNYPGALCFQDSDGDTLLHIVTHHQDLAKIYALVEQLLKMELEAAEGGNAVAAAPQKKWFNAPNRCGETPLHLAVQHRQPAVVDYLLEAGASANTRNGRPERDAPLHYAAARGMRQMVETICGHSQTNVNLANGMGLTALLYAVKNHGVVDEEQPQQPVDNCGVIEALLRHHADPLIADATSGKTVIHYAVERLEVKLIEVFRANLPPHLMSTLVKQRDLSGETPLHVLEEVSAAAVAAASPQPSAAAAAPSSVMAERSSTADVAQLRAKMYRALMACGSKTAS